MRYTLKLVSLQRNEVPRGVNFLGSIIVFLFNLFKDESLIINPLNSTTSNGDGNDHKLSKSELKKNKKQLAANAKIASKKQLQNCHVARIDQEANSFTTTSSTAVIREEDELGGDHQNPEPSSTGNSSLKKQARSKKFFDQWKQAASMSKLGNRTKNLLGKFKSHSQSVEAVSGGNLPNQQQQLNRGKGIFRNNPRPVPGVRFTTVSVKLGTKQSYTGLSFIGWYKCFF